MLNQLNFILRLLFKTLVVVLVFLVVFPSIFPELRNWVYSYYTYILLLLIAYLWDRTTVEQSTTLLTLPLEAEDKAIQWISDNQFSEFNQSSNRINYVKKGNHWYEKNDFVRLWKFPDCIKMKIDNKYVNDLVLEVQGGDA